jgi:hypothetical protein
MNKKNESRKENPKNQSTSPKAWKIQNPKPSWANPNPKFLKPSAKKLQGF